MSISRAKALAQADRILDQPRSRLPLRVYYGKHGLTVQHKGRAVTKVHFSRKGKEVAKYVLAALGVDELPPVGTAVLVTASSGVLFRVLSLSCLDPREPAEREYMDQVLAEAARLARAAGDPGY